MPIEYLEKIPGKEWLLVRTMPRSEKLAENFFRMNGIACYLPRYNKVYVNSFTAKSGKAYSYKRLPVLSVMFPGYIFAALDLEDISNARRERSIAQVCLHGTGNEDALLADLHKVQEFEFYEWLYETDFPYPKEAKGTEFFLEFHFAASPYVIALGENHSIASLKISCFILCRSAFKCSSEGLSKCVIALSSALYLCSPIA